ncbi:MULTISPECIES: type IX secretion system outer membrane channel protein PorV [unclassified Flavobacterium]|uniref:type IX secretion system outer membrane channel protein PorV n=1 Tax=unclassified Flavobacterium TaxID=196869 RepID=UPI001F13A83B|nr:MULTISPECIES: type IX secretion system outer membrane channel protein PorV [unclassified Flavobacterium]UMY67050.1 type IX secretion system outer membrane channel protein PorV [Flavobacterium sp. HJ-32-4]
MKKIASLLIFLAAAQHISAQADSRVITTGVPFLLVAADARSAGLADQGVATSPDVFSQQYNPAKYAFSLDKQGFSVSYTPYLTDLVNGIALGQVTYYNRFGAEGRSAFAASLRYFGLGDIELTEGPDSPVRVVSPSEFALDGSYALKLSDRFSMSVAGRYIRSNLRIPDGISDASAATSFAVDIAGYYQSEEQAYTDFNGRWRAGFNFQNMGPKISYDSDDISTNFLPANMRLGGGFDFIFDEYNKVGVGIEFTKLLVPTPPKTTDMDGDGDIDDTDVQAAYDDYRKIGWVEGIFKSFGDAPDGISEELKEVTYSLGAEYLYQDSFAFRLGYFNENKDKGARKFFSLGAGFKYNVVKIDVSYLFSASKVRNPLENTLRFSLTFNFGEKYDEY